MGAASQSHSEPETSSAESAKAEESGIRKRSKVERMIPPDVLIRRRLRPRHELEDKRFHVPSKLVFLRVHERSDVK